MPIEIPQFQRRLTPGNPSVPQVGRKPIEPDIKPDSPFGQWPPQGQGDFPRIPYSGPTVPDKIPEGDTDPSRGWGDLWGNFNQDAVGTLTRFDFPKFPYTPRINIPQGGTPPDSGPIEWQRPADISEQTIVDPAVGNIPFQGVGEAPGQDPLQQNVETGPSMDLEQQPNITEAGDLFEDYWTEGFRTGEFSDVENRRMQLDRENDQFEYMVMKTARDRAAQMGLEPGTAGYEQLMRDAMAEANQRRLGAEQTVNQMQRDYRDNASTQLGNIEQAGREFAIGERGFEFSRDDIEYMREQSDEIKDEASARAFISNIKDPKLRQNLENALLQGGPEAVRALANNALDEFGTIQGDFASQDPALTMVEGINKQIDTMTVSPDGDEWEPGEKEAYASELIDSNLRQQYGLNDKEIKEFHSQNETNKRFQQYLDGEIEIKDFSTEDWENMDSQQLQQVSVPFNSGMTFLKVSDFENSDFRADVVEHSTDDGEHHRSESSAGQGNGSVVLMGGKPYRVTRFWSKKDTAMADVAVLAWGVKQDERKGRLYGVPLTGENAGQEVLLSETDWEDL